MQSSAVARTRKQTLLKLALLLFSLVVGADMIEILSRCVYTKPWYDQLLDAQRLWRHDIHTNALGLRGPAWMAPKRPGTTRILLLGDSFTYGHGIPDDDAIFAAILQSKLSLEAAVAGRAVEVLNGGLWGSLTGEWVELLEKVQESFQPDIVVMIFFLRDGTRTSSIGAFFGPIRDEIAAANRESALYQSVCAYRLYKDRVDRKRIQDSYARVLIDSYLGNQEQTEEWRTAQANMRKIKAIARNRGADTALVVFPVLVELNDKYPFNEVCRAIETFGVEEDMPTHSLLPAFLGKSASELWISPLDQHPNARAHAIAADSLQPFFRDLLARKRAQAPEHS